MRHRVDGRKFDRPTGHRMLMLGNLVTDLMRHEHLTTTEAKAKEARGIAEHIITLGKGGTLAARRQALRVVTDPKVVHKVFDDLARRYAERPGGYTRILRLGPRIGDNAEMVRLELV